MKKTILLLGLLAAAVCGAQTYSIDWYKIAGGGGNSAGTNGSTIYSVSGTIGQHDASTTMSGGQYAVTGGFWSLIALVQLSGSPLLTISHSGNSAIISWPYPSSNFVLQTNANLSNSNAWANFTGTVVSNVLAGSNSVTITPPVGNLFFRLGP
jgi:hypothetical protein